MSCHCAVPYIGPSLAQTVAGNASLLFMSALNNLIISDCNISEMCDRIRPKTRLRQEYDFIVVGGGSAGSVAAARLSDINDVNVLLIEAGNDEPPGSQVPSTSANFIGNSYVDWNYKTEPEPQACLALPDGKCDCYRGKVLGGCGTVNSMQYIRGVPEDYKRWVAQGNLGWSYEELLPIFKRSEDNQQVGTLVDEKYHGVGGPISVERSPFQAEIYPDILQAARKIGYATSNDFNGKDITGFAFVQSNLKNATRDSSARAYLRPRRFKPNLDITLNSTVTKILIQGSSNQKTASSVQFFHNQQTVTVRAKHGVILSAGAINSPQILLLSGIGSKTELDKVSIRQTHELPGVGQNLHDHVSILMTYAMRNRRAVIDLDWAQVLNYFLYRQGKMASMGSNPINGRVNSKYANPSGNYPDLQIFVHGYLANYAVTGQIGAAPDPNNPNARRHITLSPTNLHPKSRGNITLRSNNPFDPPLIYMGYLKNPDDVKVLIDGIRIVQRLVKTSEFGGKYGLTLLLENYKLCTHKFKIDSDNFWECVARYYTDPKEHPCGTCKMGPASDRLAVVDSNLQVHGINNLYVMDASIMPAVLSGNLQATCFAIAEKGVDYIKKKYLGIY